MECSGSHINQVRRDLVSAFKRNREKAKAATAYSEMLEGQSREHSSRCNQIKMFSPERFVSHSL